MKQTHLAFAIITALSLAACGGSSSGGNSTNHTHVDGNDSHSTNTVDPDNKKPTTPTTGGSPVSGSSSSGGFNNATTPIETATIIASAETADAITDSIKEQITLSRDGEVNLADTVENVQDSNSYDIGIHGIKKGDLKTEEFNQLSAVKAVADTDFATNGKALYVRDPAVTGWKYQTFGHAFENNTESKGFTSIGKAQDIPKSTPSRNRIYYSGVAMGEVDNNSEVAAQLEANVNLDSKTLNLNIYNSKIAKNNISSGYNGVEEAPAYDFTASNVKWNPTKQVFEEESQGNKIEARLYGPVAQEVGGTYERKLTNSVYTGAFGGSEVDAPIKPAIVVTPQSPRDGNGVGATYFDGKFKAMKSLNTVNTSNPTERKHTDAKWNSFKLTPPNTIIGNTNPTKTGYNIDQVKVKEADPFDIVGASGADEKEVTVQLENSKEVKISYHSSVDNNDAHTQDGEYIAQSVHIFGNRTDDQANWLSNGLLNTAYVYGRVSETSVINDIKTGIFNYDGSATYRKNNSTQGIQEGTSHFLVDFVDRKVLDGTIKINGINDEFKFGEAAIDGSSFQTSKFNNSGTFINSSLNPEMRGRFYGKSGNFIGGAFYDQNGIGTFFSSKGQEKTTP